MANTASKYDPEKIGSHFNKAINDAVIRLDKAVDEKAGMVELMFGRMVDRVDVTVDKAAGRGELMFEHVANRFDVTVDKAAGRVESMSEHVAGRVDVTVDKAAGRVESMSENVANRFDETVEKAVIRINEIVAHAVKETGGLSDRVKEDVRKIVNETAVICGKTFAEMIRMIYDANMGMGLHFVGRRPSDDDILEMTMNILADLRTNKA